MQIDWDSIIDCLVAQREGHSLGLGPDPDVANDRAARVHRVGLLDAHVGQRVLTEYGMGTEVGRQKAAVAFLTRIILSLFLFLFALFTQGGIRGQQLHVGLGRQMVQVLAQIGDWRHNADLYWT
jgi:hypothetical protein